jgi:hypothetical protein
MTNQYGAMMGFCAGSDTAPDAVYSFTLASAFSDFTVTVTGEAGFGPRAYVWDSCAPPEQTITCQRRWCKARCASTRSPSWWTGRGR